jgi:hypothetical protein
LFWPRKQQSCGRDKAQPLRASLDAGGMTGCDIRWLGFAGVMTCAMAALVHAGVSPDDALKIAQP